MPTPVAGLRCCRTYQGKRTLQGIRTGKDKGKGKGKRVVRTQLSIQDRKVRLASLKKNSRCLRCGGYGHWAGDPECKMPNKKPNATASVPGQVPSQGKVAYFALSDSSGDDGGPLPCVVIGAGTNKKSCGYLGYRTPQGSPAKAKARSPLRPSPVSSDGSFSHVSHASHASGPRVPRTCQAREPNG